MSREIPADVADLPTIEAEYWLTTTEDRVGMEGPEFDDEGNLYVCSVGMTYPINYILKVDGDKNITTDWEGTEANPIGGIYVLTAESGYKELTVLADKLPGPNGVELSPDGTVLWVGMTNQDAIYRINVVYKDGTVAAEKVELIYQNSGAGQPDSNEIDGDGNLYQAMIQGGRVLVLNGEGTPVANVIIPEREQGSRMMSSNLAIKPGTNEAYLMTAGFGEGSHIYVFETLAGK